MSDERAFHGWAIHKDADKYAHLDKEKPLVGAAPGYLPASELTPESRAKREAIHKQRKEAAKLAAEKGDPIIKGLDPILQPRKGGD